MADQKQPEPAATPEPSPEAPEVEVQQSNVRSPAKQDKLSRIIKQHPRRDIPRVESVEPAEAPSKE
jgi:hypothetical protein